MASNIVGMWVDIYPNTDEPIMRITMEIPLESASEAFDELGTPEWALHMKDGLSAALVASEMGIESTVRNFKFSDDEECE